MTNYILSKATLKAYQSFRKKNRGNPVCLAPWKSLRFEPDGEVSVCCHNNSYVVGHYPEDDLKHIWKGSKIRRLRKKLSNADFSCGCQVCYEDFRTHNFDGVNPLLYEKYDLLKKQPVILDFKTETACNLRCIMCSEYSSSSIQAEKHINAPYRIFDKKFIMEMKPWIKRVKEFRFSGGEPFMSQFYFKLWQTISEVNPRALITVQTNGTILADKIKTLLERGNFSINVSLDAINKDIYEKIRIGANMQDVKNNVNYFSQYSIHKNITFGITACIMKDNWKELPEILRYANKKQALIWYNPVYYPFVNALWLMPPNRLYEIYNALSTETFSEKNTLEKANKQIYETMLMRIKNWADHSVHYNENLWINKEESMAKLLDLVKDSNIPMVLKKQVQKKLYDVKDKLTDNNMLDLQKVLKNMHRERVIFSILANMSVDEMLDNFKVLQKPD